jgi:hypothetical protein
MSDQLSVLTIQLLSSSKLVQFTTRSVVDEEGLRPRCAEDRAFMVPPVLGLTTASGGDRAAPKLGTGG